MNGVPVSRRWFLNGAVASTGAAYTITKAGALVYEATADRPGGTATASDLKQVPVAPGAKLGQIGFNTIHDNGQGAPSFVYLNRMKSGGANGQWSNGAPVSQWGYPTAIGAGKNDTGAYVGLRRPGSGTLDYVFRHNGQGLGWSFFGVEGIVKKDQSDPNRVIFTVAARAGEEFCNPLLLLTGARTWPDYKPGNPVGSRDGIAIYELSEEADYLAGKQFRRKALDEASRTFGTRWMDVQKTNNSQVRTTADKTPVGYCTYSEAAPWGPPIEVMIDFANETSTHLYVCVPYLSLDQWKRVFLTTIRDRLRPDLLAFIEWQNEVWNGGDGFQDANGYARQQARILSGNNDWTENHGYGIFAARLALLTREIFGASHASRVVDVFARQLYAMHGAEAARIGVEFTGNQVGDLFPAMAVSFYTGGPAQELGLPSSTASQKALLMAEVARYEATGTNATNRTVRQELVDQIWHGNAIPGWPNTFVLDDIDRHWADAADFCRTNGIKHLIGYEGQNPHTSFYSLGPVDGMRANQMMYAWKNDPRVSGTQPGSYMNRQYEMSRSRGMTAYFVLTNYGPLDQYGSWLTKPSSLSPNTRQWDFYEWYNINAPAPLLLELNLKGDANGTVGVALSKKVVSFGGAIPVSVPTLLSGSLPPGVTFAKGVLSGTPTVAGSYPLDFAVADATGKRATLSVNLTIAAVGSGRKARYIRIVVEEITEVGRRFVLKAREAAVALPDGTVLHPVWSGPRDDSRHSQRLAIPELGDSDTNTFYQSPMVGEIGPIDLRGDLGSLQNLAALLVTPAGANVAPGRWKAWVYDSAPPADWSGGTLVLNINEPNGSAWIADTVRSFPIA